MKSSPQDRASIYITNWGVGRCIKSDDNKSPAFVYKMSQGTCCRHKYPEPADIVPESIDKFKMEWIRVKLLYISKSLLGTACHFCMSKLVHQSINIITNTKKKSELRIADPVRVKSAVIGKLPAQRASNAACLSISWRQHVAANGTRQHQPGVLYMPPVYTQAYGLLLWRRGKATQS